MAGWILAILGEYQAFMARNGGWPDELLRIIERMHRDGGGKPLRDLPEDRRGSD